MTPAPHVVRYSLGEWEMRCENCGEWWPIDLAHWQPNHGLARCRECRLEWYRVRRAGMPETEADAYVRRIKARLRYAFRRKRLAQDPEAMAEYRERRRQAAIRYRTRRKAREMEHAA